MKSITQEYYNKNAKELYELYNSANMDKTYKILDKHIKGSDKLLDIGFGSGRDMLHFKRRGVTSWGVDSSDVFVDIFKSEYPSFAQRIFHSSLPSMNLPNEFDGFFSVIYSIATWMHIPREEHFKAILDIKKYLRENGKVIISYSVNKREDDSRFFEDINPQQLAILFESFGFELIESNATADGLGRVELEWITQVYQLTKTPQKSIYHVENVLQKQHNKYRFAELLTLSKVILSTQNRFGEFRDDGYVYFPKELLKSNCIELYSEIIEILNKELPSKDKIFSDLDQDYFIVEQKKLGIKLELYLELYRYGSFIEDSIIIRWAKYIQNFGIVSPLLKVQSFDDTISEQMKSKIFNLYNINTDSIGWKEKLKLAIEEHLEIRKSMRR
jgi:cyclopropane fatty-acyl-phospholipid synthase-like methyltransferase